MPAVLITGAGSGIGRAAALQFAQGGWDCLLVDISAAIDMVAAQCLQAGARSAKAFRLDLTQTQAIAQMCAQLPPLDALVNNAGLSDTSGIALVDQSTEQLARLLRLNLDAPRLLFEACMPLLKHGARVVNVASGAGLKAIPWRGMYSPTKAGAIALTKGLAQAYPQWVISVLCPGFVRTDLVQSLIDSQRLVVVDAVAKIPMGRLAEPEEIGEAIVFLAQPTVQAFSGQVLSVDGGSSIYGGSKPCSVSAVVPLAATAAAPLLGLDASDMQWGGAVATPMQNAAAYAGVISAAPLTPVEGVTLADAVLNAARMFRQRYSQSASLVVLLPHAGAGNTPDWRYATELATARMLVATLAAEWGADALRINALVVDSAQSKATIAPFVQYLAGPLAQFVTGQTLDISLKTEGAAHG